MSKRFKSQDYFRYKKLGTKWRKPKGRQSKLRLNKGGSGMGVSIGYRTPRMLRDKVYGTSAKVVTNPAGFMETDEAIIIASGVGAKKTKLIAERAKQLNVRILNMKKARRSLRKAKSLEEKRKARTEKKKVEEKRKVEEKEKAAAGKEKKPESGREADKALREKKKEDIEERQEAAENQAEEKSPPAKD